MITIITFWFSLLVVSGMVAYKVFEARVRKIHLISNTFAVWDHKVHAMMHNAFKAYMRYKKIARIFLFEFLPEFAYELLGKAKDYVAKKYYESATSFRGRRVLRSHGSVSFFLEKLAEEEPRA